jgi:hypothetical protein
MRVDRRLLGWGLFFILLGGIPLAAKAGLVAEASLREWPLLWPVLLIGWGLGLLLRGSRYAVIAGAITAVTFGVMGGSALAAGFGGVPFGAGCTTADPVKEFSTRSGDFGSTATANIVFNCGTLDVSTADGTRWNIAGSDRDGVGPDVVSRLDSISIQSPNEGNPFSRTGGRQVWDIVLPRSPVLALGLTLNAGDGNLNLAGAALSTVSMTLNAGSMTLDLGTTSQTGDVNATVNAGSAAITLPGGDRDMNLSLNAGSVTVCVPSGAPVRVAWSSALGSNNFGDIGLVKVDDDTFTTAGFSSGQPHLELDVSANAGSFELRIGGVCNA